MGCAHRASVQTPAWSGDGGKHPMLMNACRIALAMAVSTLLGPVDRAFSQVVSTISATPAQYSGAGETITFTIGFTSGNVVVAAVNVKSALGVAYTCAGWASGQTGQTGTCTGRYTTKAGDLPNAIQEAPTVTLLALGNVPHQLTYQGSNIVITVAAAAPAPSPQKIVCDEAKAATCRSLVQNQIPWRLTNVQDPATRHWSPADLGTLCRCPTDPAKTVNCFQNALYNNGHVQTQRQAIEACARK